MNVPEIFEELQRIVREPLTTGRAELAEAPVEQAEIPESSRLVTHVSPKSVGADRFRYLRMRLRELRGLAKLQSLTITSALPRDGKSTVALNMATTLAERGEKRVVLVDADLHNPSLGAVLKLAAKPGLAECLEEELPPIQAVSRIEPLGFYLMQAGSAKENPTELLQGERLEGLLGALRNTFEWIVIDTPPVAPLSDAVAVSRQTDGTLLVLRAGETPVTAVDEAVALLGPQRIVGMVFNAAEGLNKLYSKYTKYYQTK
jgi:capsular exopolysaccharide synthesis family protein